MEETTQTTLRTLDLGCGACPRRIDNAEPFGLDVSPGQNPQVKKWDAVLDDIPFASDFFNRVFAHDFLEHVPKVAYVPCGHAVLRKHVHVELFNEVWRVLKPMGIFEICVPIADDRVHGNPTHCSVWCQNSFNYFCAAQEVNFEWEQMKVYGYKARFRRTEERFVHGGGHLFITLQALKPTPDDVPFD